MHFYYIHRLSIFAPHNAFIFYGRLFFKWELDYDFFFHDALCHVHGFFWLHIWGSIFQNFLYIRRYWITSAPHHAFRWRHIFLHCFNIWHLFRTAYLLSLLCNYCLSRKHIWMVNFRSWGNIWYRARRWFSIRIIIPERV